MLASKSLKKYLTRVPQKLETKKKTKLLKNISTYITELDNLIHVEWKLSVTNLVSNKETKNRKENQTGWEMRLEEQMRKLRRHKIVQRKKPIDQWN